MIVHFILLFHLIFVDAFSFKRNTGDPTNGKTPFLVSHLPGLLDNFKDEEIPLMFAGQLELYKENDTHLFFWKYSDPYIDPEYSKRTIFWLNGGPGCSSMDGALMEVGPFRISDQGKVVKNDGSWHKAGNIVFVDQPAGTGFSYSKEFDHDLDQVSFQFLKFMENYFKLFPEDADNEIFFAGESYAGQYIPYIADGILNRNKNLKSGEKPYDLKGLLIGNGWIAPNVQSLSYLPYSLAAGIIDEKTPGFSSILRQHEKCQNAVNNMKGDSLSDFEVVDSICESILTKILGDTMDSSLPEDQQCYNMYDYTLKDSYPSCGMNWPPDLVNVEPFLNSKQVQLELNLLLKKSWRECNGRVGNRFTAKNSKPAVTLLPKILEQIPVVLFHGNRDIICNYIGAENFIKELEWNGATGFQDDEAYDWVYDKELSGYIKTERNLTYINVFDTSHMVPFDKPELSRSLIDILVGNYDTTEENNKRSIVTYPLGVRKLHDVASPSSESAQSSIMSSTPVSTGTPTSASSSMPFTQFASPVPSAGTSTNSTTTDTETGTLNGITRIIQLIVLVVIVWGIYMLYATYRSRPSSIIKTRPSGKKKNVQWADQLRQFQDEEEIEPPKRGLFAKALNVITRRSDRGYAPVDGEYAEDIELGENLRQSDVDQFIVDSDEDIPK